MARLSSHLAGLVDSQVPALRDGSREHDELVDHVRQLVSTRFPSAKDRRARPVQDRIKKLLLARPPADSSSSSSSARASSSSSTPTDQALRFANLARRLPPAASTSAAGSGLARADEVLELLLLLSPLKARSAGAGAQEPVFGLSSVAEPRLEQAAPLAEPERPGAGLPSRPAKSRDRTASGQASALASGAGAVDKGKGRALSKAQMLEEWNASIGKKSLPAQTLLRESLYLLQGISGVHISFSTPPPPQPNPYLLPPHHFPSAGGAGASPHLSAASFDADDAPDEPDEAGQLVFHETEAGGVSAPVRGLLRVLGETGWLVRNVEAFVREVQEAASGGGGAGENRAAVEGVRRGGLVEQSLCHFLQTQLTEYYHLISILETQMSSSSTADDAADDGVEGFNEGEGLTLMRLGVWTREARLKMRLMSLMVDDCRSTSGGQLVSRIHSYTENGDPFARSFTDSVLEEVSKPFFYSLAQWIYHGDLHDPFQEFFVLPNPSLVHTSYLAASSTLLGAEDLGFGGGSGADGRGGEGRGEGGVKSWELWKRKWEFKEDMRPSFVSEEFARKIFSTGKSLNFIRYSCQDSDWIATRAKLENAGKVLQYSDIAGLERSIDAAYEIASKRLLEIFFDKFQFMDHLRALKMYLLLGHGDFVDTLMGALASDLSKPANQLYRHTLTATLESSIRSSNAAFDPPAVRRRLDARMLPYAHGESGWDCFVLDYKVDAPVDTILDPRTMEAYQRMFVHLWKLKRVESALSGSWMRLVGGGNSRGSSRGGSSGDWHQPRVVHAEMLHFVRQLQAFYQLEVIECSWQAFEELIAKNEDGLDGLMKAHREYLGRLMTRILLVSTSRSGGTEDSLLRKVQEVFQIILDFRTATETLYRYTLEEEVRIDSQRDAQRGVFTQSTLPPPKKNAAELARVRAQIKDLSTGFQNGVNGIVASAAAHPDPEVKLLAIRCSYNAFYNLRPLKEKRKERVKEK